MPQRITKGRKFIPKEDSLVFTQTELNNCKAKREWKKKNTSQRQLIKNFTNKHGGFTFLSNTESILQKMNPATVGRLAYLSTYLDHESQVLVRDDELIFKSDLPSVLNVSRPTANKFFGECAEVGLLEDKGKDGLYLAGNLFFKGTPTNKERTKLFRVTIQQLYKKLPQKSHDLFGYIIQLVPWINFEWNIVCENPAEKDKDCIVPMSLNDVCKKLGYDPAHPGRLKDALIKPVFVWENYKQPLCGFFSMNAQDGRQSMMVVNPHILFAGSHIENVGILDIAFTPRRKKKVRKNVNKL